MKTIKKILMGLAAVVGFTTAAWAAAPIAVWDGSVGDFTAGQTTKGVFTLDVNENVVADGAVTMTAGKKGIKIGWTGSTNPFGSDKDKTFIQVLVRYSDLSAPTADNVGRVMVSLSNTDKNGDYLGTCVIKDGVTRGIWGGNSEASRIYDNTATGTMASPVASGVKNFVFSYSRNDPAGVNAYVGNAQSYGNTGLKATYTVQDIYIGGSANATDANFAVAENMKIYGIAIFNSKMTADEMNTYKFPSEAKVAGDFVSFGNTGLYGARTTATGYYGDFQLTIPASADLPAGSTFKIKEVKVALNADNTPRSWLVFGGTGETRANSTCAKSSQYDFCGCKSETYTYNRDNAPTYTVGTDAPIGYLRDGAGGSATGQKNSFTLFARAASDPRVLQQTTGDKGARTPIYSVTIQVVSVPTPITATVSSDTSWSLINWVGGTPDANSLLELTVTNGAKITLDTTPVFKQLNIKGTMTIAANGKTGVDLAKCAVAGVPYSYSLITGNVFGTVAVDPAIVMPTGYHLSAAEVVPGYGARAIVTAPDAAKFGSVNLNFMGNTSKGTSDNNAKVGSLTTAVGAHPVTGTSWNDLEGKNQSSTSVAKYVDHSGTTISTGSMLITVSGVANSYGSGASKNTIFYGYCDDSQTPVVTIGNIPFAKYRVVVYRATDTANTTFSSAQIGTSSSDTKCYYSSDWDVKTVSGATEKGWGNSNSKSDCIEGSNFVVSDILEGTVGSATAYIKSTNNNGRGGVAAIQVVEVGDYVGVKEFNASINEAGTTNLTQLAWDQTFSPKATDTATITIGGTVTGEVVLNLDVADMSIGTFKVVSSGSATLKLTGNNPTAITKWDFTDVVGKVTFGFEPEFAKITKGTYPCIGLDYNVTGTIQSGYEYLGANNALTLAEINSGTVVIGGGGTFSGDLDVYGNASVTIGGTYTSPNNNVKLATSKGTLTIAEGANISVTSICLVNSSDNSNNGIFNINGTLTVTSTCGSTVYGQHDNHKGILFAHYNGSSAVTVGPNGQLIGENTWIQLTYTSTSSLTINGGTVKVLGLNIGSRDDKADTPVTVTNGGTLELKEGTSANTRGVYTFNGGKLKAWGDYTFAGKSVTLTGDNTIDPAGYAITLSTATSGEGNATVNDSVGTGSVDFGTARPRLKAITAGTVKLTATSAEMETGTITLPYAGSVVPATSSIVITKTDGNVATWADTDPITLADNVLTLKFKVNAPITSSTTLSEAQAGKTGVLIIDGNSATPVSPLVFTFDAAVADGITQIRILGNVQLGVSGSITQIPMAKLSFDSASAPVFAAAPDADYTIPAGATYTIVGGADADHYMSYPHKFVINGTLKTRGYIDNSTATTESATDGVLTIVDGAYKYGGKDRGLGGVVNVQAGATFYNKVTGDSFAYAARLNVWGTYDGGKKRVSCNGSARINLYSGCVLNGEGDGGGAFDFFEANSSAITVSAADGSTTHGKVVVNCPIKLRNANQTQILTVNNNTHVEFHGAIIGSGNLQKNGNSSGNSTVAFYGANTFTGTLTVNAGYMSLMPGSSYACSSVTAGSNTALELGGTSFSSALSAGTSGEVVLPCGVENNARIDAYGASKITGAVTGNKPINVKNGGTLELAGAMTSTDKVTVENGGTLKTSADITLSSNSNKINASGTLEVVSGTLNYGSGQNGDGICGTLTVDKGATFVNTQDSDALHYGGSPTINVKGTVDLASTRWSMGANCKLNLYPGCTVSGAGQGTSGALDFFAGNTNFKVVDDGNTDAVTLSAAMQFRDSDDAKTLDVGAPVTVNVSGVLYGDRTFTLTGVPGSVVALSSTTFSTVTIVSGAGVTLAPAVNIPKLTLNAGATVEPADENFQVTGTFTKNGAYHIDGSLVLTDPAETYTLLTLPGTPDITGVTVTDADGNAWKPAVSGSTITATKCTPATWDSQSGKWVDGSGNPIEDFSNVSLRFQDGDNVTFNDQIAPAAVEMPASGEVTITNQNNLVVYAIDIPAETTLVLGSNAVPGFGVTGTGTLKYAGVAANADANAVTVAQLANFGGTFWITGGRHRYSSQIASTVTMKVTDGGQLLLEASSAMTWDNQKFILSGEGWTGYSEDVDHSALRIHNNVTMGSGCEITFVTENGKKACIGCDGEHMVNATLKGTDGFRKRGGGTVILNAPKTQATDLSGDVVVTAGTLRYGNEGSFGAGEYELGDSVTVDSGATFYVHLIQNGTASYDETGKAKFETPIVLNGGTLSKRDGRMVFASIDVAADSTFFGGNWGKHNIIRSLTGSHKLTLTANNGDAIADVVVLGGSFTGTVYLNHSYVYLVPKTTALQDATVQINGNNGHVKLVDAAVTLGALTGGGDLTTEADASTLTVKGGTYSGVISGAVSMVVAGDVTLSGANTYSGTTTVDSGTLTIAEGGSLGTGNYTVAEGATLNLGQYRPTTAKLVGTSAGTVIIKMTSEEQSTFETTSSVTLIDVEGTTLAGSVQILKTDGTVAPTTVTVSAEGKLVATKRENTKTPPYNLTTAATGLWTAASWMDSAATPAEVGALDWDYEVGANIALAADTTTSLTLDRLLTLSTLNITNAGTLAIADTAAFTLTATTIDDSASTGTTTLDFAPGAATITAGQNTILTKAGTNTGLITVQNGKKATVPAWYFDHRALHPGGYLKIEGDIGSKTLATNGGIPSAGATVEIAGTAEIAANSKFEAAVANTKIIVSGTVTTASNNDEIKLANNANSIFEVAAGELILQNRVMVQQQNPGTLILSGGKIRGTNGGYLHPGGGWSSGSMNLNITGGEFLAAFRPNNTQLGFNGKVNVSGGVFAPEKLWTSNSATDDTATSRSGSNFAVNMTGGKFLMPAGVPNWLPVNITSGVGELGVQDGVTTAVNRGLLTVASGATARIKAGSGTIQATGGIASSGTIALVSGTLKVDSDTFTLGTVKFNGGTLDINGKTVSGLTLTCAEGVTGTIHNSAATDATVNGIIIPAGESKQVVNGVIVLPEAEGALHFTVAESTTANWSEIIWLNSENKQVRIIDVSKVDSAALTVEGTLTFNTMTLVTDLGNKLTVSGSGLIVHDGGSTETALPTALNGLALETWTGTVWYKNYGTNANTGNLGVLANRGNADSIVKFTNIKGYITDPGDSGTASLPFTLELEDGAGDGEYAWDNSNGWSGRQITIAKLTGSGMFAESVNSACRQRFTFTTVENFTGRFWLKGTKMIGLGCSPTDSNGTITIGEGVEVAASAAKPWQAGATGDKATTQAAALYVNGHLTATDISNIGGTGDISVGSTGTIEFTKSCASGDDATDYSRVKGAGKFKLSGDGWFALPNTSAKRPATTLQFVTEKAQGVIITESGTDTIPTTEIGTLSGSKGFRTDWGSTSDNSRNLRVTQAHNSIWHGNFNQNSDKNRLYKFIVAGKSGATEKMLTLTNAGGNNTDDILEIESSGSVCLASTAVWKGPVTLNGELAGTGTVDGAVTFGNSATLWATNGTLTVGSISGNAMAGTVRFGSDVTAATVNEQTVITLTTAVTAGTRFGTVHVYAGDTLLGDAIMVSANGTVVKPLLLKTFTATIADGTTGPVDFDALVWSPAAPTETEWTEGHDFTIENNASAVTVNMAKNVAMDKFTVNSNSKTLTVTKSGVTATTAQLVLSDTATVVLPDGFFGGAMNVASSVTGKNTATLVFDMGMNIEQEITGSTSDDNHKFTLKVTSGVLNFTYGGNGGNTSFRGRAVVADGGHAIIRLNAQDATGYTNLSTGIKVYNGAQIQMQVRDTFKTPIELQSGSFTLMKGCGNGGRAFDLYANHTWTISALNDATAENPTISYLGAVGDASDTDKSVFYRSGQWTIDVAQYAKFVFENVLFYNQNGSSSAIIKNGLGELVLNNKIGSGGMTAPWNINAGKVTLLDPTAFGTGLVTIAAGATVEFDMGLFANVQTTTKIINIEADSASRVTVLNGDKYPWLSFATEGVNIGSIVVDPSKFPQSGLHIYQLCPKPGTARVDRDANGRTSGWVDLKNYNQAGGESINLADYKIYRYNITKAAKPETMSNLCATNIAPGETFRVYISEEYANAEDYGGDGDNLRVEWWGTNAMGKVVKDGEFNHLMIVPQKVNPKKYPMIGLYKNTASVTNGVIDQAVVPCDLDDAAIVELSVNTNKIERYAVQSGIRTEYGPDVSPLYGVKGTKTDLELLNTRGKKGFVPATEDCWLKLPINPFSQGGVTPSANAIKSVRIEYRTFGLEVGASQYATTTNRVVKKGDADEKTYGKGCQLWEGCIPQSFLADKAGQLIQFRAEITDGTDAVWHAPRGLNKNVGHTWYGFVVQPTTTTNPSETSKVCLDRLQTFLLYVDNVSIDQMDKDIEQQDKNKVQYGARINVYDTQTHTYYDNVRIDLRGQTSANFLKKSHGLRFSKVAPLVCTDPFTGEKCEYRKTSFIAEYGDPAYIRQTLALRVMRESGIKAPFDYPVRLYRNGEYYQLAFHSNRFTDEIVEDYYKLNAKTGYAYKNVGAFIENDWGGSKNTEKKTPDDDNERGEGAFDVINAYANRVADGKTGDELTTDAMKHFNIPAWINYLAAARVTQECDDVWTNLGIYINLYDEFYNPNGDDTMMPLAYDQNLSFGMWYRGDDGDRYKYDPGIVVTNDMMKSHPFYSGKNVRYHKWNQTTTTFGEYNRGMEAMLQNATFREMLVRRIRTLAEQYLGKQGADKAGTPIWDWIEEYKTAIEPDVETDHAKWEYSKIGTDAAHCSAIWIWPAGSSAPTFQQGIDELWNTYITQRRIHLYDYHAAKNAGTTGYPEAGGGYATGSSALIPESQSDTTNFNGCVYFTDETGKKWNEAGYNYCTNGIVQLCNTKTESLDLSGWSICGAVDAIFAPGTVIPAKKGDVPGKLWIVYDRQSAATTLVEKGLDSPIVINLDKETEKIGGGTAFVLRDPEGVAIAETKFYVSIDDKGDASAAQSDTKVNNAIDVPMDWIDAYASESVNVNTNAQGLADQLVSTNHIANGIAPWQSYVLGLIPDIKESIPVIEPVQSSETTKIKFQLGGIVPADQNVVDITYTVYSGDKPGEKKTQYEGGFVGKDTKIPMALPESGVQYYIIEVQTPKKSTPGE